MQDQLRRRLIGAVILVSLGVIFIPMILDRTPQTAILAGSPVPAKPGQKFEPLDIPLEPPPPPPQPTAELVDRAKEEADQAAAQQAEAAAQATAQATAQANTAQGTITRAPAPQAAATAPRTQPPAQPAQPPKPARPEPPKPVAEPHPAKPPQPVPPAPVPVPVARGESWIVQVGSFSSADNAQKLKDKLRGAGFPAFVERLTAQEGTAYKVRIGPMAEKDDADTTRAKLQERMSMSGIVVRYQ